MKGAEGLLIDLLKADIKFVVIAETLEAALEEDEDTLRNIVRGIIQSLEEI